MRVAWRNQDLCKMEKSEPRPLKRLIRAFLWGNDLKAFPLLKSAFSAVSRQCHLKPTTATTTWNSKQKLKSAIFCLLGHYFVLKSLSFKQISLQIFGASKLKVYLCSTRIRHASHRTAYQGGTFCLYAYGIYKPTTWYSNTFSQSSKWGIVWCL